MRAEQVRIPDAETMRVIRADHRHASALIAKAVICSAPSSVNLNRIRAPHCDANVHHKFCENLHAHRDFRSSPGSLG